MQADPRVVASVLRSLFDEPLKPVKASAQKKVPVPDGLDLDAWIVPPDAEEPDEFMYGSRPPPPSTPGRPNPVCSAAAATFMSSFGDDDSDNEYAGAMAKRRGTASKNAGSDDDLWGDLAGAAATKSSSAAGRSKDRASNPFMLASSSVRPHVPPPILLIATSRCGGTAGERAGVAQDGRRRRCC